MPAAASDPSRILDDNAESVAVVIGNKSYKQTSTVDFAHNDAEAMRDYLVRGLRFREQNVFVLKDATLGELTQMFGSEANPQGGRLWRSAVEGRSNVFVYYSGHGVPDLATRQPFLLPQDGNPNASESGYALQTLYRNLELVRQKIGAQRQLIVMIDACFTGETGRKGESLLAVSAPGFTPAKPRIGGGIVKLVATSGATPANWDENQKLGLFTSRFLMGAAGLAQADADRRIAWPELQSYVVREVEAAARRDSGREQKPEFDTASLSLPTVEPSVTIRRSFESAQDEARWRSATADGSREALERYVAQCTGPCAYRQQAMDRLLQRQRNAEAVKDDESWRQFGAEGRYQAYLDACNQICAYRQLALGYLGKDPITAIRPEGTQAKQQLLAAAQPIVASDPARALAEAKAAGTVEALDRFLKVYPEGKLATEAFAARLALVQSARQTGASHAPTAAADARYAPGRTQIDAMAPAGPKRTPVMIEADMHLKACPSQGIVAKLGPRRPEDPKSGFLSVRSGPGGSAYVETDRIYNGDILIICDTIGPWHAVIYPNRGQSFQECRAHLNVKSAGRATYSGSCRSGWVHKNYVEVTTR
ncbi:caspase family protein [Bosea sp. CRIB-10]|uniref:caspase family protein n=1 Tax=Bosea sp. CRIB-10 TaxID=378404 RepID=UPI001FCD9040|nr:caspase family protein [Bosea sp. CRIB-10]